MTQIDQELRDKLLLDTYRDIGVVKETMARIEVNIAEHIRRTNILEAKVTHMERLLWMFNGATTLVTAAFMIAKYWLKLI
jgi:hypothetical protein